MFRETASGACNVSPSGEESGGELISGGGDGRIGSGDGVVHGLLRGVAERVFNFPGVPRTGLSFY